MIETHIASLEQQRNLPLPKRGGGRIMVKIYEVKHIIEGEGRSSVCTKHPSCDGDLQETTSVHVVATLPVT